MKFLCKTEIYISGDKLYIAGKVYDFTKEAAEKLIRIDENITLGALSFFTAADEEAVNYLNDKGKKPEVKKAESK